MAGISWYSTAADLSTQDHGVVDLAGALTIVGEYFDRLKRRYASGEEALAATTFGFARGESSFLEICLHAPTEIAVTVESSPGRGFLGRMRGPVRTERAMQSRAALERCVTAYFTLDEAAFHRQLQHDPA